MIAAYLPAPPPIPDEIIRDVIGRLDNGEPIETLAAQVDAWATEEGLGNITAEMLNRILDAFRAQEAATALYEQTITGMRDELDQLHTNLRSSRDQIRTAIADAQTAIARLLEAGMAHNDAVDSVHRRLAAVGLRERRDDRPQPDYFAGVLDTVTLAGKRWKPVSLLALIAETAHRPLQAGMPHSDLAAMTRFLGGRNELESREDELLDGIPPAPAPKQPKPRPPATAARTPEPKQTTPEKWNRLRRTRT